VLPVAPRIKEEHQQYMEEDHDVSDEIPSN
jgi:outer membrane protein assembly factor BamE